VNRLLISVEARAARVASHAATNSGTGRALRKAMLALGRDPEVTAMVAGRRLALPLSHALPTYLRAFPDYSMNVGRLASAVGGPVIDIGANVGDTAAIIRKFSTTPILCVEGHPKFLSYLRRNVEGDPDIEIAAAFVGQATGKDSRVAKEMNGTMSLTSSATSTVDVRRLADILVDHPRFGDVRMLKSDTDGYEATILLSLVDFLAKKKPVLFFEYDPASLEPVSGDPQRLLKELGSIGYNRSVVYDNKGALLLTTEPGESRVLLDLDGYIRQSNRRFYVDIALFHNDDHPLFESFRTQEMSRFYLQRHSGARPA
jgi:FkbM family methyltransferase